MRRTMAEYKRLQRRRDKLKKLIAQEQDMQRQQVDLEKRAQYLASLGQINRDIQALNFEYGTKGKLIMADLIELGGQETGSAGGVFPVLFQHDRLIHDTRRDLSDHRGEHVSVQEHAALKAQVLDLQEAYADVVEILDKVYRKLYGKGPEEE